MPVKGRDKPYYGVNFGPIHFTTFSTEHPFEEGTEQYKCTYTMDVLVVR